MERNRTAKHVLRDLVGRWSWCGFFRDHGGKSTFGKPGDVVKALSPEDRELLKDLKAEDIKDDRLI